MIHTGYCSKLTLLYFNTSPAMPNLSLILKPRGLAASSQSSSVSCREISMEDVNETELTMKNQKLPGTDQPQKCWIPDSMYLFIVLREFDCLCSLWL